MTHESVCLSLPGAGTALGVVAGAVEVLAERYDFAAVGGTSGGGIVALGLAYGLTPAQIVGLAQTMLTRKDLLDKGWPFDQSPGVFRGRVIERLLRETFGERTTLGDLGLPCRVTAWDSWTRMPVMLDSRAHPDVLVWRAARTTMAIEFFFDLVRVREDNARLYGDGGLVLNVPHGMWDDRHEKTIGLRFSTQDATPSIHDMIERGRGNTDTARVHPVRGWADLATAVARTAVDGLCGTWPSSKTDFSEVVLDSDADGFAFGLSPSECDRRANHGRLSARRWLARQGSM